MIRINKLVGVLFFFLAGATLGQTLNGQPLTNQVAQRTQAVANDARVGYFYGYSYPQTEGPSSWTYRRDSRVPNYPRFGNYYKERNQINATGRDSRFQTRNSQGAR
jgi:hypothetical protein